MAEQIKSQPQNFPRFQGPPEGGNPINLPRPPQAGFKIDGRFNPIGKTMYGRGQPSEVESSGFLGFSTTFWIIGAIVILIIVVVVTVYLVLYKNKKEKIVETRDPPPVEKQAYVPSPEEINYRKEMMERNKQLSSQPSFYNQDPYGGDPHFEIRSAVNHDVVEEEAQEALRGHGPYLGRPKTIMAPNRRPSVSNYDPHNPPVIYPPSNKTSEQQHPPPSPSQNYHTQYNPQFQPQQQQYPPSPSQNYHTQYNPQFQPQPNQNSNVRYGVPFANDGGYSAMIDGSKPVPPSATDPSGIMLESGMGKKADHGYQGPPNIAHDVLNSMQRTIMEDRGTNKSSLNQLARVMADHM